jgi:MFS family permease
MPDAFIRLLITRALFTFAVQMQAVIVAWRIYALTHDALALGLVGLAEALPALSLALYGGLIVDRGNPRTIYRAVLSLSLASALALLAAHRPGETMGLRGHLVALYGASVLTGVARAFSQPAMYALMPRLVARQDLARASAWMSSSLQISRIAGPAFGGIAYGYFGMLPSTALICVLLVGAITCMGRLPMRYTPETRAPVPQSMAQELFGGLTFVLGHPILLPALSLDMISVLFGGVTAVLPIYAEQVLHLGPRGLGLLRAAPAIGAAIGSIALTRFELRERAGTYLLSAVGGFGACILIFGVSHNLVVSVIALGLSGAFDSVSMLVRTVMVQLASPEHMRGRIAAVNSMFIGSSNELGELESGVAAKVMGTVPSVIFGGCMCLLTVAAVTVMAPTLRKLDVSKL